jgi:hypothetical protein
LPSEAHDYTTLEPDDVMDETMTRADLVFVLMPTMVGAPIMIVHSSHAHHPTTLSNQSKAVMNTITASPPTIIFVPSPSVIGRLFQGRCPRSRKVAIK